MSGPKKVLYISSRGDIGGGGENYLLTLFNHLERDRFIPLVVLPSDGSLRQPLEKNGIEVMVVEADYGWLKPDATWYDRLSGVQSRVQAHADLIRQHGIDLVHTNSNLRFEGALAARLCAVPHLYLAHIEYQPDMPIFQRLPLDRSSFAELMGMLSGLTVAVSGSVAATLEPHIAGDQVEVIHNGLELDLFDAALEAQPNPFRAELALGPDDVLVTAAGRIAPDKGFDLFVEAVRKVSEHAPGHLHFAIAGDAENSEHASMLEARVSEYGLADRFHFLGYRSDIADILAGSDVFVLSSRKEGHPYIMLEAMASRCPVVACKCAGVEETLEEGVSGYMVELEDVDALGDRILRLVASADQRHAMAAAARARIEDCFTAKMTADRLMESYGRVLDRPPVAPGSIAIDLFLQACSEIGRLGSQNIDLERRLSRLEGMAGIVANNPVARALGNARNLFGKK